MELAALVTDGTLKLAKQIIHIKLQSNHHCQHTSTQFLLTGCFSATEPLGLMYNLCNELNVCNIAVCQHSGSFFLACSFHNFYAILQTVMYECDY